MWHNFDLYGWYAGTSDTQSDRSTDMAPMNLSTDPSPGLLRANFTGHDWLEMPYDPPPAPVVPERVPMLNAHLELIESGWMPEVDAFIATMPEPDQSLARAYLTQALTMARNHPLVLAIPTAIGKTEAEVDQLFVRAGAREV